MPSFGEADYLRRKARVLASGLASRLDEFVEEFPSGQSSAQVIATLNLFLDEVEVQIDSAPTTRMLRWYCILIEKLAESLEWLDHSHTAQTPRACVEILKELSEKLFSGAQILVAPTVETNYLIWDETPHLQTLANSLPKSSFDRIVASLPTALYRVRFPRIEKDNVLNHALFGHEFGHPIVDEFFALHETKAAYRNRLKAAQKRLYAEPAVAAALSDATDEVERAKIKNAITDELITLHKRGLEEIGSDAIAVFIFGPSALFSALDLFVRDSLDDPPKPDEFYPPTRYRWRFMLTILEQEGYLSHLKKMKIPVGLKRLRTSLTQVVTFLTASTSIRTDLDAIASDPVTREAYAWLEMTLPDALKHARKRVQNCTYSASAMSSQVPHLLERLDAGVPPSEYGVWPNVYAVDWRSTIAASWLVAINHTLNKQLDSGNFQDQMRVVNRLAAKGIEYILLKRKYEAFKAAERQ